ncbi:hypothetical protein WNZ15_11680 [Roseibium sp. AS2]|uniref:hypothetical protein n=1 Tax=Roseibium sp. AS2 TaxID=3135781 RepID=UPI00316CDB4D
MAMNYTSINEDRGARRAAELRRRFAQVSSKASRGDGFGFGPVAQQRLRHVGASRRSELHSFLAWSALAAVVVVIGMMLFRAL